MAPIVTPISVAMAATVSAISMSFSTPAMTWANMSFPMALVPKGLRPRRRNVEVVRDVGVAVLPEVADQYRGDAEQHEDAEPDHGERLVDEPPEDDPGLALGLPREPVRVARAQLDPGAGARQGVRTGLHGRARFVASGDEVLLGQRLRHSGSSGRGRRRGCRRPG